MAAINIDKNLYPIVIISSNKKYLREKDVDEYIEEMTDFYRNNTGVVVIYDMSLLTLLSSEDRKKIGKWLEEKNETIKNAVKGVCYVEKNALQRLSLKGIFMIKKPEWSHKTVRSVEDGISWAKTILN